MGKLVYIIEDDPMTQMLLKTMLNQAGIESKIFSDFHTAIEEIDKDKKNQNFPVAIFSDFMMPQGDGLDFLHQLTAALMSVGDHIHETPCILVPWLEGIY